MIPFIYIQLSLRLNLIKIAMQAACKPDCMDCLLDIVFGSPRYSCAQAAHAYGYGDERQREKKAFFFGGERNPSYPQLEAHSMSPVLEGPSLIHAASSATANMPASAHIQDFNSNSTEESTPTLLGNIYESVPISTNAPPPMMQSLGASACNSTVPSLLSATGPLPWMDSLVEDPSNLLRRQRRGGKEFRKSTPLKSSHYWQRTRARSRGR